MSKLFFVFLWGGACIFTGHGAIDDLNVINVPENTLWGNEDCCDELRSENIQRKMEIELLTEKLEEEITNRIETLDNVQVDIDGNKMEISTLSETLDGEVKNRKQADDNMQNDLLGAVPLGTILPWINKPTKDSSHQEDVPVGFAVCDGSFIEEGIWLGQPTPDLTNSGKFLRGGTFSEMLNLEDYMTLGLNDPGHSHTDSGHKHTDAGHKHRYQDGRLNSNGGVCGGSYWGNGVNYYDTETGKASIQNANAQITSSHTGMSYVGENANNIGKEVRPTNMRVIYIMKVVSSE